MSRNVYPAQAQSRRALAAILGAGKLPFSFTSLLAIELAGGRGRRRFSALRRPLRQRSWPGTSAVQLVNVSVQLRTKLSLLLS